jgi:hypothetical protein
LYIFLFQLHACTYRCIYMNNKDIIYTWGFNISQIPILVGVDDYNKVKKTKWYQKEGMAVGLFSFVSSRTLYYGFSLLFLYWNHLCTLSHSFLVNSYAIQNYSSFSHMLVGSTTSPHLWNIILDNDVNIWMYQSSKKNIWMYYIDLFGLENYI